MTQLPLFPAKKSAAPAPRAYPEHFRKRLNGVLRLMFAAEFMPWNEHETRYWIESFAKLANKNLPADEAAEMIAMFDQQIARLQAATTARNARRELNSI